MSPKEYQPIKVQIRLLQSRVCLVTLLAMASLLSANQSYAQANFLLAKQRAGDIEIGMAINTLHTKHPPSLTKLVAQYPEGEFTPVLEVYLEDVTNQSYPSLSINLDMNRDWVVRSITVTDARYRTARGIGVGSTLGDLRKTHAISWIGFGEGPLCANVGGDWHDFRTGLP